MPTVADLRATVRIDDQQFRQGLGNINRDLAETAAKGDATARSIRNLGESASSIRDLGQVLTVGLTVPIVGLGVASVQSAIKMDSLKRSLISVSGSVEAANKQLVSLKEVAKLPGLGFAEAVEGSVNLQSVGLSAEFSERAMKAFGNALGLVGRGREDLQAVVINLQQIASAGKLTGDELRETAQRVPQLRKALMDAFGTSSTEEISKMGYTAEQVIEKMVEGLEKLPKASGGVGNDFENLTDTINTTTAAIGNAFIPAINQFVETAAPAIENTGKWFSSLDQGTQQAIIGFGAFVAIIGPATFALGTMFDAGKKVAEGTKALVDVVKLAIGFITGKKAALDAETAAVMRNTAAHTANAAAVGGANAARMTPTLPNIFTKGEAGVLAARGAAASRFGFLGGVAAPAGIIAAGVAGGYALSAAVDARQGKSDPGIMATLAAMNPWNITKRGQANAARADEAERNAAMAEFQKLRASGQSPAQLAKAQAATSTSAAKKVNQEELQKLQDSVFQASLEQARTQAEASPEERKHAAEAAALVPVLQARQTEIMKRAADMKITATSSLTAQKEHMELTREAWNLQGQMNQLQAAAAKEQTEAQKKATEDAKDAREAMFASWEQQAQAAAAGADEGEKAAVEARAMWPVLQARAADIAQRMKAEKQDSEEYFKLRREYFSIVESATQLQTAAQKEAADAAEKRKKDAEEANESYREYQMDLANLAVASMEEGEQTAGALAIIVPQLRANQAAIMETMKTQHTGMKEYWENARAIASLDRQILDQENAHRKFLAEQEEESIELAKKNHTEQQKVFEARTNLMEQVLKNNPFLNDQQRQQLMIPALLQQYQGALQGHEGESESERLTRLAKAAGMSGDIMGAVGAGKGGWGRVAGGGRIPLFDTRLAAGVMGEMRRMEGGGGPQAQAASLAREAAQGRPVIVQLVVDTALNPDARRRQAVREVDGMLREVFPSRLGG